MIIVKSEHEIEIMREAGKLAAMARAVTGASISPGITTRELNHIADKYIREAGAIPSFLGYGGFPGSICCSVNDEVIHGIPGDRKIKEGDLVKIDVGTIYRGFQGDCAATFICGKPDEKALALVNATRQSFYEGIKFAKPGNRISDISAGVQQYAESCGYSVVRDYVGHGIGREMHEDPEVPNFVSPGARGPRLVAGMTIAVEPMINLGGYKVNVMKDGWTVKTADGLLSAHYENTIVVTAHGPEILTACELDKDSPYL